MSEKRKLSLLYSDRRAVTAMEYGLIAALVAVTIVLSVTSLGASISTAFATVATNISTANAK